MTTSGRTVGQTSVTQDLVAFLEQRTKRTWEPDTDLFESGLVSSLFAMELVVYLEKAFGVSIIGQDLMLDNFRTVNAMVALVERLTTPKA